MSGGGAWFGPDDDEPRFACPPLPSLTERCADVFFSAIETAQPGVPVCHYDYETRSLFVAHIGEPTETGLPTVKSWGMQSPCTAEEAMAIAKRLGDAIGCDMQINPSATRQ